MLKVVGASWEKTRLFSIIIALMIILAFFLIFFYEMPIKKEDGMYAATVFYRPHVGVWPEFWGQNNNPSKVPLGVARAYYKPSIYSSGWASIEIETSSSYPDQVQAYAAGLLEGALCWQLIYWHWRNTIQAACLDSGDTCDAIRKHLEKVEHDAITHANKSEMDEPFWHHVNLFYTQLSGLEDGWNIGVERSRKSKEIHIDHVDFLWLNTLNEIKDLKIKYGEEEVKNSTWYRSISFLKYLPNSTHHFLLAHESAKSYSAMLRIHKKYKFGYHWTAAPNSAPIPAKATTFTSYPGAIHSQDDYYQIDIDDGHSMTIAGTNIHVNRSRNIEGTANVLQEGISCNLCDHIVRATLPKSRKPFPGFFLRVTVQLSSWKSVTKVPIGPRAMAACRLSRRGIDWAFNVNKHGGIDIGGKQWIILDYSREKLSMWLVEQVPGLAVAANVTVKLREKNFWISAGIPFFDDTLQFLGRPNISDASLYEAVRIIESTHENATSPEKLISVLKNPELIALGRPDIIQFNKGYKQRHEGIIDIKISDASGDVLLIAGPPYSDEVNPFRWSSSALQNLPHYGQPDLWKYDPVHPTWVW